MATNEHKNQAAREWDDQWRRPSLRGIYFICPAATTISIGVIIFLNLVTPLESMHGRLTAPDQIKALHLGRQLRGIFTLPFCSC